MERFRTHRSPWRFRRVGLNKSYAAEGTSTMNSKYLRHYTDIPALIYLLRERKITLRDPQFWEDRNDSHYLRLYRDNKKLESVSALCFTQTRERYQHWRVFANGPSGVAIRFKRLKLLEAVKRPGLHARSVKYRTLEALRGKTRAIQDLPFIKRYGFEHECEFRMIYDSETPKTSKFDIAIHLKCINRIKLSPWLHEALVPGVTEMLRSIKGCSKLKIVQSALISSEAWKKLGDSIAENAVRLTGEWVTHGDRFSRRGHS